MNKISHIFFDMWGVILDSSHVNLFEKFSEKYNLTMPEFFDKIKIAYLPFEKWEFCSHTFLNKIKDIFGKKIWLDLYYYRRHQHHKFGKIYPEMIDFVQNLQNNWYKCVVLSDTNELHKEDILKKHGYQVFDDWILSCDVWMSKQEDVLNHDDKIFEFALDRYGISWQSSLFLDDRIANCEAAERAGIKSIQVLNPRQVITEVENFLGMTG